MKRSTLLVVGCAFASVLLFAACGGGGTETSSSISKSVKLKDFPENATLGKLPGIFCQYLQMDSVIRASYNPEYNELKEKSKKAMKAGNEKDWNKYEAKIDELLEKEKADKKKNEEDMLSAIGKEKENLIGKKIPFEVEEGAWFEMTDLVVSDITEKGNLMVKGTFKLAVDEKKLRTIFGGKYTINGDCLDSNGNTICPSGYVYESFTGDKTLGSTETYETEIPMPFSISKAMLNFDKIRFKKR